MRTRILLTATALGLAACSSAHHTTLSATSPTSVYDLHCDQQPDSKHQQRCLEDQGNLNRPHGPIQLPTTPPGGFPPASVDPPGIYNSGGCDGGGPIDHSTFKTQNRWWSPYKGRDVTICAGGSVLAEDTSHFTGGAILLVADDHSTLRKDVPNSPTWVKIIGTHGSKVHLQREDGSNTDYDLDTDSFSG